MSLDFWRRKDKDLEDELQAHLRMAAQDRMDRGEAADEAEASARRELGNVQLIKEVTRSIWGRTWLERFVQDLRFGARVLRKNPGTTFVSVLTLGLGISASTAIFSVVYGILLRPLPYAKPEQVVQVWEVDGKGTRMHFTDPNFDDVRTQNHSLQGFAEFSAGVKSVSGGSGPRRLRVAWVSNGFFAIMGVQPVRGREFATEELHRGAAPAALVSYSYWQELGGASDLSQLKLNVENKGTSIIGVLPPGFHFPEDTDIWMARETDLRSPSRTGHNWETIGLLRDGTSVAQAQNDIAAIGRRLKQQYGQDIQMQDAAVLPLKAALTGDVRPALLILLGAVGFLLLVACANVMNLLLAQASAREGELAVRAALGASRGRLVRQFLAETLLLSLAGAALGVIAAYFGVQGLVRISPPNTPRVAEVGVNLPVLFFALGLSILVALVLGVFTALRATSGDLQSSLVEAGRGQGSERASHRLGRTIIAAQLAMTLLLLVGAGLEGRSLLRVLAVDPGFRTEQVVTIDLALPPAATGTAKSQRVQFLDTLFDRLRALPGVSEAGGSSWLPMGSAHYPDGAFVELTPQQLSPQAKDLIARSANFDVWQLDPKQLQEFVGFMEPLFHDPTHSGYADYTVVSEGYLRALDIPLLRGRLFEAGDTAGAPHVALISESLARSKWPGQDPLGRTIEFGNMDGDLRLLTVVGVVGDVRGKSLEVPPRPVVYVNYRQRPHNASEFSIVMRTAVDPSATLNAARTIVGELDPSVPLRLNTFTEVVAASLNTRRFNLVLVGIFAGSALLLAIAGIYGVLAYSVARRTREIGVRIALGASVGNVRGLVLRQAMLTALAGIAIGLVGAIALTRTMRSLLFEISNMDPLTYCAVAVLLLLVAALAAYLPARRATRVDPIIALRHE